MTLLWLFVGCGDFTRDTADTGTRCTDPVSCPVTVSELVASCGDSGGGGGASALAVEATAPGTVAVSHTDFREGCCPDFAATAVANRGELRVDVAYSLTNDSCDCVCSLDLTYTLSGIQTGEWTIAAGFDAALVTLE